MNTEQIHTVSSPELRQQLILLKQQQAEIARAFDERLKAESKDFAEGIRKSILEAGYDVQDIMKHLVKLKVAKPHKEGTRYALISNPEQTYVRGPLPFWMKKSMDKAGLDWNMKADCERFKNEYMTRVQ
ncbi:DNA-binding protein H-NS [Gammaproteobacteria bacterium]